ncbi:hypothetical protein JI749_14170 [Devosia oryziradicis]|uniref:DUF2147 domain-containing protein n=1 Tax=Devosia oryziradicis TaxID=2801335 RepID=A0ABX7C0B2_9HYPH|nr:hypothetical protein [Devosia oryziradicis]QQR35486.1 hypothetical protein JI749_14170 [Devosia oryziradicis]
MTFLPTKFAPTAVVLAALWGAMLPASAADLLTGDWHGSYICYQGLTRLALVIMPDGDRWTGRFMFGPHESNPNVPFGSYDITVTETAGVYTIMPGDWVDQPDGYAAVGGSGTLSADMMTLSGKVNFDGCGGFEVTRLTPPPAISRKKK